jgi:RNA polymerase sigma-70 factor (ECF subfamily)
METVTSITLLEAIKNDQDSLAWDRFISRYRPMIVSFSKRFGLDDADAEDVGQETLLAFLQSYRDGQYNREKGRLRSWLFGVAQRKVIDTHRKNAKEVVVPDQTGVTNFFNRIESPDEMERVWNQEWQRSILRVCMEEVAKEVSPQTLAAFECYVIKKWSVEKTAQHLGLTINAVYIIKNRVLGQVRKIRKELEENW